MCRPRFIRTTSVALGLLSVALLLSGCRDAAAPPPISVAVSPTHASVTAATAQSFSATVVNDAGNAGVRSCGTTFVRATSVADPTRSGSAAVSLGYPFCSR